MKDSSASSVVCVNLYENSLFTKSRNISDCNSIEWLYYRARCLSGISGVGLVSDLDKDGLNFMDEIYQGTNPENPDTDGDGFLDGAEVEGGYNPLGDGKEGRWWLINDYQP